MRHGSSGSEIPAGIVMGAAGPWDGRTGSAGTSGEEGLNDGALRGEQDSLS